MLLIGSRFQKKKVCKERYGALFLCRGVVLSGRRRPFAEVFMKYTRKEMTDVLVKTGLERTKSMKVVSVIVESMTAALVDGKVIELRGLGTLEPKERKARVRHNPQNMKPVHVPKRKTIIFRMSGNLKEALNGGESGRREDKH